LRIGRGFHQTWKNWGLFLEFDLMLLMLFSLIPSFPFSFQFEFFEEIQKAEMHIFFD
jgi:hypothetical protein